jgi:hypothetical protein
VDLQPPQTDPQAALTDGPYQVEGEIGAAGEGPGGSVLLFVKAGRLDRLEFVYFDEPPSTWPAEDNLRHVRRSA